MDTKIASKARESIEKAEESIKSLISEAAMAQDYGSVTRLAEIAQSLAVLVAQLSQPIPTVRSVHSASRITSSAQKRIRETRGEYYRPKARAAAASGRPKKNKYPVFNIEPDRLTKIGWSKKRRSEYQHRAPLDAVASVFRRIQQIAVGQAAFTIDDLMPVEGEDGDEIPSYQVYMIVAWLVDSGLLEKQGRDGYRTAMDQKAASFESIWQPESKSGS